MGSSINRGGDDPDRHGGVRIRVGRLDVWIGDKAFTVAQGDSFRIRNEPYRWANPYPDPAVAIWVIALPVY